MNNRRFMEKLLTLSADQAGGVEVEWKALGIVFEILAGGDVPKDAFSDVETQDYNIPILSNGIGDKALYGWTDKAKIEKPSLTISARGTIGWTSYRDKPFFPIVRLIVLTPKIDLNLKYAYYFMKTIENCYKVPPAGIPQLTKPMLKEIQIPIPCPNNSEISLAIQAEIVRILDTFTELTTELTTELNARKKQYNYYRDQLLSFPRSRVGMHTEPGASTQKGSHAGAWEPDYVEWKTLGDIGEFMRGKRFTKADYVDDGISVIHYGEIYTRYGVSTSHALSQVRAEMATALRYAEPGDVVITDVGETVEDVGKAVAWLGNEKVAIHDHCYAFRHSMNPKFVSYCMQTDSFIAEKAKYIARTKVNTLLINGFLKVCIPVPPLEEQARIVAILDKFDTLTNSISEGLPREIELRQKQYEYYRDLLLSFPRPDSEAAA